MSEALHHEIIKAAKKLRDLFDEADISNMILEIEVSGRVHDEIKIEYKVRKLYDSNVTGANLDAVTEEFLRRNGWNARNAPLMLTASTMKPVATEEVE